MVPLIAFLLLGCISVGIGSNVDMTEGGRAFAAPTYLWQEARFPSANASAGAPQLGPHQAWASDLSRLPIYISVTTISNRLEKACDFFQVLFAGNLLSTHAFLFISRKPWLMDQGISDKTLMENARVQQLMGQVPAGLLSIVFTDNLGPHRKLLPLLARKWAEDCIIVTFDDESGRRLPHLEGPDKLFSQILRYYRLSDKNSIVGTFTHTHHAARATTQAYPLHSLHSLSSTVLQH